MKLEFLVIAFLMSMIAISAVTFPWLKPTPARSKGFAKIPILVALAAVGLAIALYVFIGRPDATHAPTGQSEMPRQPSSQRPMAGTDSSTRAGSVASLLGGLEERVAQNPDNGKDWLLLAKSYDHLGRHQDAVNAYQKAAVLGVTDATLASKLNDAHSAVSEGASSEGATIKGRLSLSAAAADQVKAGDTVFIVAKEAGGPPMPLAVIKRSASDLPIDFVLSDQQTMVAGRGISSVSKVIVEAKVSATGDALNTKPGIGTSSTDLEPGAAPFLTLELDVINNSTAGNDEEGKTK